MQRYSIFIQWWFNIVNLLIPLTQTHRINEISIKFLIDFFGRNQQPESKMFMKRHENNTVNKYWKNENLNYFILPNLNIH